MGIFSFLVPKNLRFVNDDELGNKFAQVEDEKHSWNFGNKGYWKVVYVEGKGYVTRHGKGEDFGDEPYDEDGENKFLYNLKNPEDYENVDECLYYDYDDMN
jgi:asparagine synthetase A